MREERSIARVAARQHGVVTIAELKAAGVTRSGVTRRVRLGRLHRLHRGVYAVGHENLSDEGRSMAAVLACGEGAALSHESAAALWRIIPTTPSTAHVTVPTTGGRKPRPGIRIHYSRSLSPRDRTLRKNIPVTTHARTLADLGYGPEPTRSALERAFLRLCRRHGLPRPEVNVPVGPYVVDFLWRDLPLVVETDGYRHHSSRGAFEADRARDRELRRLRFTVLRFTYREVTRTPLVVVSVLRPYLLERGAANGAGQGTPGAKAMQ